MRIYFTQIAKLLSYNQSYIVKKVVNIAFILLYYNKNYLLATIYIYKMDPV
jgi:hypothetical protein